MHVRMWEKTSEARAEEVGDVPNGGRLGMTRSCRALAMLRRLVLVLGFSRESHIYGSIIKNWVIYLWRPCPRIHSQ